MKAGNCRPRAANQPFGSSKNARRRRCQTVNRSAQPRNIWWSDSPGACGAVGFETASRRASSFTCDWWCFSAVVISEMPPVVMRWPSPGLAAALPLLDLAQDFVQRLVVEGGELAEGVGPLDHPVADVGRDLLGEEEKLVHVGSEGGGQPADQVFGRVLGKVQLLALDLAQVSEVDLDQ